MAQAGRISVGPHGRIDGTLTARVSDPDDLRIDGGATLGTEPRVQLWSGESSPSRYLTGSFYLRQAVGLLAAFVTGWLLLLVAPGATDVRFETPVAVLKTLGVGFLCVLATPVAAIIAGVTLVGLPVALVAFGLWALGIYLAKIPVALFLGRTFLGPHGSGSGPLLALLVGLLAVFVAVRRLDRQSGTDAGRRRWAVRLGGCRCGDPGRVTVPFVRTGAGRARPMPRWWNW